MSSGSVIYFVQWTWACIQFCTLHETQAKWNCAIWCKPTRYWRVYNHSGLCALYVTHDDCTYRYLAKTLSVSVCGSVIFNPSSNFTCCYGNIMAGLLILRILGACIHAVSSALPTGRPIHHHRNIIEAAQNTVNVITQMFDVITVSADTTTMDYALLIEFTSGKPWDTYQSHTFHSCCFLSMKGRCFHGGTANIQPVDVSVCHGLPFVELEFTVGPIPIGWVCWITL